MGLQRYAAERFVYRLGRSPYRERFVLKGATLYTIWGYHCAGPRDLDFTGYIGSQCVIRALREV